MIEQMVLYVCMCVGVLGFHDLIWDACNINYDV